MMALRRSIATLYQRAVGPISLAYKRRVESDRFRLDNEQLLLSLKLDDLYFSMSSSSTSWNDQFFIPKRYIETVARYYGGELNLTSNNIAAIVLAAANSLVNTSRPSRGVYIHGSVVLMG
jgi:hypothetical protein